MEFWERESDGTLVEEINVLTHNGPLDPNSRVRLEDGCTFDLRRAEVFKNNEGDILGWRFQCNGKHYVVLNDGTERKR